MELGKNAQIQQLFPRILFIELGLMWKCFKYYWALPFIWTWYLLLNTFFLLNSWFSQLWSLWRLIDIYYMLMDIASVIRQNGESQTKKQSTPNFPKKMNISDPFPDTHTYVCFEIRLFTLSSFYEMVKATNFVH